LDNELNFITGKKGLYLIRSVKCQKVQLIFKKIGLIEISAKTLFLSLLQPAIVERLGGYRDVLFNQLTLVKLRSERVHLLRSLQKSAGSRSQL